MDASALAVFVEAASAGSLAGAARRLRLEPLAASRALAALERQVGVRLMQRSTRSLSLTAEGEQFLPHARALLEAESAALASVNQQPDQATGLLRVTSSAAFGRKLLVPFITRFMRRHPALKVDVLMSDRVVDLIDEGLDLAIRLARLQDSSLIARRLGDSPRVLVASPDYLAGREPPRDIEDLERHDCVLATGQTHWQLRAGDRLVSQRIAGRFTANTVEGIHEACVGGLGIALLSEWEVKDAIADGTMVRVPLAHAAPEPLPIWAVYPTRQLLPAKVRLFVDELQRQLAAP